MSFLFSYNLFLFLSLIYYTKFSYFSYIFPYFSINWNSRFWIYSYAFSSSFFNFIKSSFFSDSFILWLILLLARDLFFYNSFKRISALYYKNSSSIFFRLSASYYLSLIISFNSIISFANLEQLMSESCFIFFKLATIY